MWPSSGVIIRFEVMERLSVKGHLAAFTLSILDEGLSFPETLLKKFYFKFVDTVAIVS